MGKIELTPRRLSSQNLFDLISIKEQDIKFGEEERKQILEEGITSDVEYFFSSDAGAIIEHTNRFFLTLYQYLRK